MEYVNRDVSPYDQLDAEYKNEFAETRPDHLFAILRPWFAHSARWVFFRLARRRRMTFTTRDRYGNGIHAKARRGFSGDVLT